MSVASDVQEDVDMGGFPEEDERRDDSLSGSTGSKGSSAPVRRWTKAEDDKLIQAVAANRVGLFGAYISEQEVFISYLYSFGFMIRGKIGSVLRSSLRTELMCSVFIGGKRS